MAQITNGIRTILSRPVVYSFFQMLMGAHRTRQNFVTNWIRPFAGMKILDVGCGPADILAYLPDVEYWGFDISESYIQQAKTRFGQRAQFNRKQLQFEDLVSLPKFDVILALGLLHHLDDPVALSILRLVHDALKPGGRLLTIDPCLTPSQNVVARFLVRNDRGQNVRHKQEYQVLVNAVFASSCVEVHHQVWIPYTHCFMECQR
jgi:2-polyprenyl-3-methyl-5-hydroxy-6-metoxy-1,4-benzoquinol methylase